jgi:hypothetical protein
MTQLLRQSLPALVAVSALSIAAPASAESSCFVRLDTGVDMTGWQKSTTNHHGPGDGWSFENGDLVGRQTGNQLGGILMSDKTFSDVEVVYEVKIDWGCDSGFFFRTTAGDRAYQQNIDYLRGAGIGTLYGEGFTTLWRVRPYVLSDESTLIQDPTSTYTPIFDLALWPTIWRPTDYNEIRTRIEGNPPRMQVWIANFKVMGATDTQLRPEIDPAGPLALQVHGGGNWARGGAVRFRNIRARDLTIPCADASDAAMPDADAGAGAEAFAQPPSAALTAGGGGCACSVTGPRRAAHGDVVALGLLALARRRKRAREASQR